MEASGWRKLALSFSAIGLILCYAKQREYSPLECVSDRLDAWVAAVMHGEVKSSPWFRIVLYGVLALVAATVVVPLMLYLQ